MKSKAIMANTHPAEYLIHKYWARKPHNILQSYIKTYFTEGNLLVDPFCGSGVFLAEAKKQNINGIGFDLNPIAYLLSDITVNPPDIIKCAETVEKLIEYASKTYSDLYTVKGNKIRYMAHEIVSKCPNCGRLGSINNSKKIKTAYYCIECNNKLSFNFENFERIEISKIIDINNNEYSDIEEIKIQTELSQIFNPKGDFDKELVINRRILSFPGMRHSDLFTPRAYSILSDLFYQAHKIEDINIKNAILLFLTSGVAQCSRLIPFRNDLSTGGPAWTMPGFWLAPIHLETNPIIHLEARYKKFVKGLGALKKNYSKCNSITKIENIPTQQGLNSLEDDSIDGIFFDPPYGDNVPYIEFSAIWNLFIKNDIDYKNEIIVSDRKEFISSWDKYKEDIEKVISLFYQKLKTHGKILMTFNNLNPKAWKVILDAFGKYSFYCIDAKYQIPAVISSKAQMASNTSYIGDFYCVFEKTESRDFVNKDLYRITERAKQVLLSRNGKVPKNLINRVAILTILNDNIDFNVLDNLNDALIPIAYEDKEYFYLRDELKDNNLLEKYNIEKRLKEISISSLKQGKKTIREFYEIILENTEDIGSPPLPEVRLLLSGIVLFDKQYCYLQNTDLTRQMALFENANQLESLTF